MVRKKQRRVGNPFEFGRAVHAGAIVDREEEIARLTAAVRNGERVFLIGPRRFGKTSLLNVVQTKLEREGIIVLKYDAEKFESTELLAKALLSGAIRALTGPIDKIGASANQQIKRFFGALKPEVKYDVMHQTLSVSLGMERRLGESDLPVLTDVLDGINAMAKAEAKVLAVVLDEFQQIVAEGGITAERQIRAAVQTHDNVSYIFSGSKTRLLTDMTSNHARPFYRMGSSLFLGPVPRNAFIRFITEGFESHDFKVVGGAVERILDLAEDVPYNAQRLAHRCWDLLRAPSPDARGTLTPAFIDRALERIVTEEDTTYTQLWVSLTEVQKKALKAVIGNKGQQLMSQAVATEYGVPPASMQKALKALDSRGIVRTDESFGTVRVRLDDPFFATWLRQAQSA